MSNEVYSKEYLLDQGEECFTARSADRGMSVTYLPGSEGMEGGRESAKIVRSCPRRAHSNISFGTRSVKPRKNLHSPSTEKITAKHNDGNDYAKQIVTRLIDNLRAKHLNEDDARVILIRRGITVSEVFPNWTVNAFDDMRNYKPYDLNMPYTLRKRLKHDDFKTDPPLTNISSHFAAELGFAMTQNLPTVLYTAPETACVQTARQIMDGIEIGMDWLIEPGLVKYFAPDEPKPTYIVRLKKETVYTVDRINRIIGRETPEEFQDRIKEVVSKLKFPREASSVIVAEDCVIDAIIQAFVRNGKKLTRKQQSSLGKRIPQLSMMHFDIETTGKWKPSCASLPGLLGISKDMYSLPDVNFLTRPTSDY